MTGIWEYRTYQTPRKSNESARRLKEEVLVTNSPPKKETSTEIKKIDHDSLHAYKHMIAQNYDRRIGETETNYQNETVLIYTIIPIGSINRQHTRIA